MPPARHSSGAKDALLFSTEYRLEASAAIPNPYDPAAPRIEHHSNAFWRQNTQEDRENPAKASEYARIFWLPAALWKLRAFTT